jgi:hypothetical protein
MNIVKNNRKNYLKGVDTKFSKKKYFLQKVYKYKKKIIKNEDEEEYERILELFSKRKVSNALKVVNVPKEDIEIENGNKKEIIKRSKQENFFFLFYK